MNHRFLIMGIVALISAAPAGTALGDVTIKQKVNMEAGGLLAGLAFEGTVQTAISNDRSRVESNMGAKSSSPGARRLAELGDDNREL